MQKKLPKIRMKIEKSNLILTAGGTPFIPRVLNTSWVLLIRVIV
jgi:hypothetical protein